MKIKINNIPGWYYVENNELLYSVVEMPIYDEEFNIVQVSDLTELTVYQYNQLAMSINAAYPDYEINELKGRFI